MSPYNPEKKIYLQTDRSKSGLGYILYQEGDGTTPPPAQPESESEEQSKCHERSLGRRIVSMGATGLTSVQRNWSIF